GAVGLLSRLGAAGADPSGAAPYAGAATVPGGAGRGGSRRDAVGLPGRVARAVAVVCAWAGLFVAASGAGLPGAVVLGAELAVTLAAGAVALRAVEPAVAWAAAGCAGAGAFGVSLAA
ncbi:hypothetical protein VR44_40585, partial [Streptomyces katrae]